MNEQTTSYNDEQRCPECEGKLHDYTELYMDECDRCLAKKSE